MIRYAVIKRLAIGVAWFLLLCSSLVFCTVSLFAAGVCGVVIEVCLSWGLGLSSFRLCFVSVGSSCSGVQVVGCLVFAVVAIMVVVVVSPSSSVRQIPPPKCRLGFSLVLRVALDKVICKPDDVACWVSLLVLPLCLLKTFNPRSNLECKSDNKRRHQEESLANAIRSWGVPGGSFQLCKRKICDGHYTTAVRVLSSSGTRVIPEDVMWTRWIACPTPNEMLERSGSIQVGYPDLIAVGTIWRSLVSNVSATMNLSCLMDGYLVWFAVGVGVPGRGEGYSHAVNHLVAGSLGMMLVFLMLLVDVIKMPTICPARLVTTESTTWAFMPWGGSKAGTRDGTIVGIHWCRKTRGAGCSALFHEEKYLEPWLLDVVAKINDPQCELLLIRACAGVSKLYFAMRTCSPRVFESAQLSFDMALRSALERIVTASGPGFGDWQWRLATLPFAFGGLGVYSAGDVLNYAFIASRLQSAALQTKLLRHVGIVTSGSTFDDALCVFNNAMEIDFLSTLSEVAAPKIMKKCKSNISTRVTRMLNPPFPISSPMALWQFQRRRYIRLTAFVCIRFLLGQYYNALRPADMLLYSWEGGLDVCVDLTGSSPLTQTGMTDFVPGRVVIDAAQRKRGKYMTKCADIGYGFLPFSFSSFGELEKDAVTLLKRVQKFSMAQDIGARAAVHIFNRISFSIAKGVGAQIVSRLPSNLL
ncbi:hypothetical protein Tco_0931133 [Tanacetum coccineum]